MDKETRLLIAGLGMPLVLAVVGWGNSCAEARKIEREEAFARTRAVIAEREVTLAERETAGMSDAFQPFRSTSST
jgi:uncharacterized protein (DUF3084 family)